MADTSTFTEADVESVARKLHALAPTLTDGERAALNAIAEVAHLATSDSHPEANGSDDDVSGFAIVAGGGIQTGGTSRPGGNPGGGSTNPSGGGGSHGFNPMIPGGPYPVPIPYPNLGNVLGKHLPF